MANLQDRVARERDFHNERVTVGTESIAMRGWWETPGGKVRFRRRIGMFRDALSHLGDRPQVLVVGCGDGRWIDEISGFARVTAIDVSENIVTELKKRQHAPETIIEVQDAHKLPYRNESFDAVIANSVLHHLDLQTAFLEFVRVLKVGGRLIAAEPNRNNPQVRIMYRHKKSRLKYDLTADEEAFTKSQIRAQLRPYFQRFEVRCFDFWHPVFGSTNPKGLLYRSLIQLERVPLVRSVAGSLWITATKQ